MSVHTLKSVRVVYTSGHSMQKMIWGWGLWSGSEPWYAIVTMRRGPLWWRSLFWLWLPVDQARFPSRRLRHLRLRRRPPRHPPRRPRQLTSHDNKPSPPTWACGGTSLMPPRRRIGGRPNWRRTPPGMRCRRFPAGCMPITSTGWCLVGRVKYRADNGQPANDGPGGRRQINAIVKKAVDGSWKVTDFGVQAVGTC